MYLSMCNTDFPTRARAAAKTLCTKPTETEREKRRIIRLAIRGENQLPVPSTTTSNVDGKSSSGK